MSLIVFRIPYACPYMHRPSQCTGQTESQGCACSGSVVVAGATRSKYRTQLQTFNNRDSARSFLQLAAPPSHQSKPPGAPPPPPYVSSAHYQINQSTLRPTTTYLLTADPPIAPFPSCSRASSILSPFAISLSGASLLASFFVFHQLLPRNHNSIATYRRAMDNRPENAVCLFHVSLPVHLP